MNSNTPEAQERLRNLMEERAYDLGLNWREVAARAKISYETIRAIRSGTGGKIRPLTARKIDRALEWEPGSVQRILDGKGDPVQVPRAPAEAVPGIPDEQLRDALRAFLTRPDSDNGENKRPA